MKLKIMIMALLLMSVGIGSAVNWLPESTMEPGANVTFQDGGGIEDAGFVNTTVLNADSMGPTTMYGDMNMTDHAITYIGADSWGPAASQMRWQPGVVIGHIGSKQADIYVDGSADDVEIESAISTYKTVYILNDGTYNISGEIDAPPSRYALIGVPDINGNLPVLRCTGTEGINNDWRGGSSFDISHIEFDLMGCNNYGIRIDRGISDDSEIHHCIFHNRSGASGVNHGAIDLNDYGDTHVNGAPHTLQIYSNEFYNISEYSIKLTARGYTKPMVYRNYIHDCITSDGGVYSQIYVVCYGLVGTVSHNIVENCVSSNLESYAAIGISATNSIVSCNTIVGCGRGIVPGVNCIVSGNVAKYCVGPGIDFWHSDRSIVVGNICSDNGQMTTDPGNVWWDRCGIDTVDHSEECTVVGNICGNTASSISSTLTQAASASDTEIYVAAPELFYKNMIVHVTGESGNNRIVDIDIKTEMLSLNESITGTRAIGTAVTGVDSQLIGIGIGVNGNEDGQVNHTIVGNSGKGNVFGLYGEPSAYVTIKEPPGTIVQGAIYYNRPTYVHQALPIVYMDSGTMKIGVYNVTSAAWKSVALS